jgi:hypothetical protein
MEMDSVCKICGTEDLINIVEHEAAVQTSAEALHHETIFEFSDHL